MNSWAMWCASPVQEVGTGSGGASSVKSILRAPAWGFAARVRKMCSYCRRGIPTHCARRRVLGIVAQDGAFAEYLALPLVNLHRVPAGIPDDAAVFTEPLAAACEILEQVNVRAHREAAVLGDGKLAQLIARVLRAAGLRVLMIGKHASKLRLARPAGIAILSASQPERAPRGCFHAGRRSDGLTLGSCAGATNHSPARHARAQVHVSRPRQCRDVADGGERTHRRRLALWSLPARTGTAALGPRGPEAADFARFSPKVCGGGHPLRAAARRDESAAARFLTFVRIAV